MTKVETPATRLQLLRQAADAAVALVELQERHG